MGDRTILIFLGKGRRERDGMDTIRDFGLGRTQLQSLPWVGFASRQERRDAALQLRIPGHFSNVLCAIPRLHEPGEVYQPGDFGSDARARYPKFLGAQA